MFAVGEVAQIHALGFGPSTEGFHRVLATFHADLQRVEVARVDHLHVVGAAQRHSKGSGVAVDALGDGTQPFRPVVHRVHPRHHGEEDLRRADVARGLVAADVLLARLHRHPQGSLTTAVDADPDDATGHEALEVLSRGEEGRVGAAEAHGDPEVLAVAQHHVGAQGAELGLHVLVATVEVVDASHQGFAFCRHHARNNQRSACPKVGGHDHGAVELFNVTDDGGVAMDFDGRSHARQFRYVHESIFKNRFGDARRSGCHGHHHHELGLHVGGEARVR